MCDSVYVSVCAESPAACLCVYTRDMHVAQVLARPCQRECVFSVSAGGQVVTRVRGQAGQVISPRGQGSEVTGGGGIPPPVCLRVYRLS